MKTDDVPVILWCRDDLRLADQAAVQAAVETGRPVLPLFILDDASAGPWAPGGASRWWLHHSLASLAASLAERGAVLTLRRGNTLEILADLVARTGATDIFAGAGMVPWAREIDRAVAALAGVTFHRKHTTTLFHPSSIRTGAGGAYSVYSPFARACRAMGDPPPPLPPPGSIRAAAPTGSDRLADWALLPTKPDWAGGLRAMWTPGEPGALRRAQAFMADGLGAYAARRDIPAGETTSMLSPHLRFGEISVNQVWHLALREANRPGRDKYLNELLWREFSAYLLWHHPALPEKPLRPEFAAMPWQDDPAGLAAWHKGLTGVPIVDAGMRQLWRTGWMHNRVRMIVASFLVKHMMIDWRAGEAWFWDTLVDADLASNAASWQWVAGSGADAAPYFRIFNPVLQGLKFDPDGEYVRQFVPELARLDARHIHAPWEAPPDALRRAGITLGGSYPKPVVDLAEGRARALAAYAQIRSEE